MNSKVSGRGPDDRPSPGGPGHQAGRSSSSDVASIPLIGLTPELVLPEGEIGDLRKRLAGATERLESVLSLQSTAGQGLESVHREIRLSNEQLQLTNEMLQVARETIDSARELLRAVNLEMQHRNDRLTQLNNDLTNLLNSVNLPVVMLGSDLSVRLFTPQATAMMGLMPSAVGRPLPRLKLKIDMRNLEEAMLEVIERVQPRHDRIQDDSGKWLTLRITPYRTLDNRIDGVVLSVVDGNGGPGEDSERRARRSTKTRRRVSRG